MNHPLTSIPRTWALAATLALALANLSVHAEEKSAQGSPEPRTPAAEAKSKVGQEAVVTGTLTQLTKRDRIWYLNVDGNFPTNAFTAVVFPKSFASFTNLEALVGRKIELTGKVADYKGKPQMVLERPSQLSEAGAAR